MSPFDVTKSITQTKDDISGEDGFDKDYNTFMINRILSNSPQTVLFADAMNQNSHLDKKLQYDFYRLGIPKSKSYTKYIKKDALVGNEEHINYICEKLKVSIPRSIELCDIIGSDNIQKEIDSRGGRK
jgi:hypothetical protein